MSNTSPSIALAKEEARARAAAMRARILPAVPSAPAPAPAAHPPLLFAYLLGWVTGLPLLAWAKSSAALRFHAAQSVVLNGGMMLAFVLLRTLGTIPLLGMPLRLASYAAFFAMIGLWAYALRLALRGREFRLPFVAELADRLARAVQGPQRVLVLVAAALVLIVASSAPGFVGAPTVHAVWVVR